MKPQPTFCVSAKLWIHSDIRIWVPFFLDPEDAKSVSVWGLSETAAKGQGFLDLTSDYGTQGARLKV